VGPDDDRQRARQNQSGGRREEDAELAGGRIGGVEQDGDLVLSPSSATSTLAKTAMYTLMRPL
jgi:hypothetical protein